MPLTKPEELWITIEGTPVSLKRCEPGYYLGQICINGELLMHFEAFRVTRIDTGEEVLTETVNPVFQSRIDDWETANEGAVPTVLELDSGAYFIHAEVYAT